MEYNKCRYNLNNISGETSGMNQILCICSSSQPQYVRHEMEKFSFCLIATAWRKRIFRSDSEQSQFYQCASGDSHYCVTLAFSLFLNITYLFPTGITIVQLRFGSDHISQTLFFLKCCFQNRYFEMWLVTLDLVWMSWL